MLALLEKKDVWFDQYARESRIKDASSQATESHLVETLMEMELRRAAAFEGEFSTLA